jgi:hypothetical protein
LTEAQTISRQQASPTFCPFLSLPCDAQKYKTYDTAVSENGQRALKTASEINAQFDLDC